MENNQFYSLISIIDNRLYKIFDCRKNSLRTNGYFNTCTPSLSEVYV